MDEAISTVVDDGMSISAASHQYDVPKKTLSDKVGNRHPNKPGRPNFLAENEEQALAAYIKYMSNHAFPLTIPMIKSFAWAISKRMGKGDMFNVETGPGKT